MDPTKQSIDDDLAAGIQELRPLVPGAPPGWREFAASRQRFHDVRAAGAVLYDVAKEVSADAVSDEAPDRVGD
jgi:hypothetical protein